MSNNNFERIENSSNTYHDKKTNHFILEVSEALGNPGTFHYLPLAKEKEFVPGKTLKFPFMVNYRFTSLANMEFFIGLGNVNTKESYGIGRMDDYTNLCFITYNGLDQEQTITEFPEKIREGWNSIVFYNDGQDIRINSTYRPVLKDMPRIQATKPEDLFLLEPIIFLKTYNGIHRQMQFQFIQQ